MRKARHRHYGSGSGPLRATVICVCDEKETAGENPLVRDRALVFSPRAPFAFVTKIPKNANKNAGGAKGGFEGGISPRPLCDERSEAQLFTELDFTFLRKFLLEVRTFFAENLPQ